jgi:hypothetical protein
VKLSVYWRFLFGAFKLIYTFLCKEKDCDHYAENIRHHPTKSCRPGCILLWGRNRCGLALDMSSSKGYDRLIWNIGGMIVANRST